MRVIFGFLIFIGLLICVRDASAENVIIVDKPNKNKIVKMCDKGKIVYAKCPKIVDQKCIITVTSVMKTNKPCEKV